MAITIPIISEFNAKGVKKAIAEFKQLEGAGAKAQFALRKATVPAAAALAGLAASAVSFVKAAAEDQVAALQLSKTLKNVTGATDSQVASMEDYITKTSMAAAVADDELRPALANLVRASGDVTRAQDLMQAALDISASTGRDLQAVSLALSRAEMGNYNSLKKLGVPIGQNTQALIDMASANKALIKSQSDYDALVRGGGAQKDIAKALEKVKKAQEKLNNVTVKGADFLKDLQGTFKGASAEAAKTAAGGMKRLSISIGEAQESIGYALLPVLEAVLPYLQKFAEWAQKNPGTFKTIAIAIAAIASSVMLLNAAFAVTPLGWIVIGIGAIITALVLAYNKFEWFRNGVKTVFEALKVVITGLVNSWIAGVNQMISAYNKLPFVKNLKPLSYIGQVEYPQAGATGNDPMRFAPKITAPGLSAQALNARTLGTNIEVNVNGGDPNAVVQTLRKYVRQTGSLPVRTAPIG